MLGRMGTPCEALDLERLGTLGSRERIGYRAAKGDSREAEVRGSVVWLRGSSSLSVDSGVLWTFDFGAGVSNVLLCA